MEFMGHAACQTKLNQIWRGKITSYTLKILVKPTVFKKRYKPKSNSVELLSIGLIYASIF